MQGNVHTSSPSKNSWGNSTNETTENFNYRHLTEESYHSTFENLTEETTLANVNQSYLSTENQKQQGFLLDDTIPNGSTDKLEPLLEIEDENDDDDEPLYATVKKPNQREKQQDTPISRLTEYTNHEQPAVLETFQSPPIERKNGMKNIKRTKRLVNKKPSLAGDVFKKDEAKDDRYVEFIDDDDDTGDYNQSEGEKQDGASPAVQVYPDDNFNDGSLGFAFSYLNSQENTPPTPPRHEKSKDKENFEISPVNYSSASNKPTRLFRGIPNNILQDSNQQIMDSNQAMEESEQLVESSPLSHLQEFQPKYLAYRNSLDKKQLKPDLDRMSNAYEDVDSTDSTRPNEEIMNNFASVDQNVDEQFDLSKTMDSHYSNFSVNDIKRQKFLPTTRVNSTIPHLNNDDDGSNPNNLDINSSNDEKNSAEQHISKFNSLSIQNQYQYQRSLSPINLLLPHQLSNTSLDDIKTYGKPVMAKSPRPVSLDHHMADSKLPPLPPPLPTPTSINQTTNTFFTRKSQLSENSSYTKSSEVAGNKQQTIPSTASSSKTVTPEIQWFSINRLKKTNNSTVLWDKDDQIEEIALTKESSSPTFSKTMLVDTDKLNSLEFISQHSPRQDNEGINEFTKSPRENNREKIETLDSSPRISAYDDTSELNILSSSQEGQYKANVRKFSNVEQINNSVVHQQQTPEIKRKTQLKSWLQNDLRPAYKPQKSSKRNPDIAKPLKSNALQAKIKVFSNPIVKSTEITPKQKVHIFLYCYQ